MHDITRGEVIIVFHDGHSLVAQMSEGINLLNHQTMQTLRSHDKQEMEAILQKSYPNHSIIHRVPTHKKMNDIIEKRRF